MSARRLAPMEAARQLEALALEAAAAGVRREALMLRLSALPPELALPHHQRLALEALEPLDRADRARLFVLPNGDAAMVWRGAAAEALASALAQLRHLFAGHEPLVDGLARHVRLPEDAAALAAFATSSRRPAPTPATPRPPRRALDLAALGALEAALAQADLTRFARRRAVCAPAETGGAWRLAWERRSFDLDELADALLPDRDLAAEPWLLRRLGATLDRRMMALLAAPRELDGAPGFGVALGIGAVLSPAFLRFDAALPARLRGRVAIEFRADDMLEDTGAYLFARDFARARGFRVVVGPVEAGMAACFAPAATGADLLRLAWPGAGPPPEPEALGIDPRRIVLAPPARGAAPPWHGAASWARDRGIGLVEAPLAQPAPPGFAAGLAAG
jgi:hypothetical protein